MNPKKIGNDQLSTNESKPLENSIDKNIGVFDITPIVANANITKNNKRKIKYNLKFILKSILSPPNFGYFSLCFRIKFLIPTIKHYFSLQSPQSEAKFQ